MAEPGDSGKQSGVRVRVEFPYGTFHNHGVAGVPDPITTDWTEPLPDAKLKQLRKVAKRHGPTGLLRETTRDVEEADS